MKIRSKAYLISLQLYSKACRTGQMRKVTIEQYSEAGYDKVSTGMQARYIPESITILNTHVFEGVSIAGIKLIVKIIAELYMNNTLWYFEPRNSTDRTVIAELRDLNIILQTEDKNIHYVNPDKIRKGSKAGVLALTTQLLEGITRVTTDHIRPLGVKKTNVNSLDMYLGNVSKSVVDEDQAPYGPSL